MDSLFSLESFKNQFAKQNTSLSIKKLTIDNTKSLYKHLLYCSYENKSPDLKVIEGSNKDYKSIYNKYINILKSISNTRKHQEYMAPEIAPYYTLIEKLNLKQWIIKNASKELIERYKE